MELCSVVLTFDFAEEMKPLRSLPVLLHGKTCFLVFCEMKFEILYKFLSLALLRVKKW